MSLDPTTSQHPAACSLDVDDRVHDDSLAERFGDLLVRFPDDLCPGDRLKLDEGSTTSLECSLEQSESSPLDNTPPLGLDLDSSIGDTTNASQPLIPGPSSENCSGGSLDCDYAWHDVCMLPPCLLQMLANEKTSTLSLDLATITFGETKSSLESGLGFAS